MYAQAAIKPNTLLRNGAYGAVMRGVQKCTCAGASLRGRNSAPLCCIKLDTATDGKEPSEGADRAQRVRKNDHWPIVNNGGSGGAGDRRSAQPPGSTLKGADSGMVKRTNNLPRRAEAHCDEMIVTHPWWVSRGHFSSAAKKRFLRETTP